MMLNSTSFRRIHESRSLHTRMLHIPNTHVVYININVFIFLSTVRNLPIYNEASLVEILFPAEKSGKLALKLKNFFLSSTQQALLRFHHRQAKPSNPELDLPGRTRMIFMVISRNRNKFSMDMWGRFVNHSWDNLIHLPTYRNSFKWFNSINMYASITYRIDIVLTQNVLLMYY